MQILNANPDDWPEAASLTDWSRHLKTSYITLLKYRQKGKLPAHNKIGNCLVIEKKTILKCFNIRPTPVGKQSLSQS